MHRERPEPSEGLPPPVLVEDDRGLAELCRGLADVEELAIDTEADSFFSYREKVCLIQITADGQDWLVDPLASLDLAPLGEVLADPRRTKVFHDGEYDVLILKRDYGFEFRALFDTRIAAAALGSSSPGLASVLEEHFGVHLDKSLQRSNWSARPLTPEQVDYARLDTHYLLPLAERQRGLLAERGRMPIVEGECRRLEALEPPEREFDPDEFIRLKGARALRPREMQALRELFVTRDRLARERDVPPFKVVPHGALVALAAARPRSLRALERCKALSPKLVRKVGRELVEAIRRAEELGPLERIPSSSRGNGPRDELEAELRDRLKAWRRDRAREEELDSSLVLNRRVLEELARRRPRDRAGLERIEGLVPWQLERYGQELLGVLAKFEADVAAGRVPQRRRRRS